MSEGKLSSRELSMANSVVVRSEVLVGKPKRFVRELVVMPDGVEIDWYYVDTPSSVVVLSMTDDMNLVFVRQYRYNLKRYTVELPAGATMWRDAEEHSAEHFAGGDEPIGGFHVVQGIFGFDGGL